MLIRLISRLSSAAAVFATLFFATLFFEADAHAFDVTPIRADIATAGPGASIVVTVRNPGADPLPIEMSVVRRAVREDGAQNFASADDDWIIFPPQALVPAGGSQAVRAQYVGEPLEKTGAFVLYVAQVPVDLDPDGFSVQVIHKLGVALYLNPPRSRSDIIIDDVRVTGGTATLEVRNAGDRYELLSSGELTLDVGGETLALEQAEIRELVANPLVPPQGRRIISFPVGGRLPAGAGAGAFDAAD